MSKINVGNELYLKGRIGWKGLSKDEYLDHSDYRIINGTALEDKHINWSKCGYINSCRYRESPEIQLEENDILISKDGTLGKIGYVRNLEKPSTVASGIFIIRNIIKDKLDTDYLYHFLKSNIFKNFIHRVKASGSTILHLYQRDLAQLELEVPTLKDQQNISKVLNTIDAKIEVNNKINQELETMAKTFYNYWFVQFDFPNENEKPYKSSGGNMVFNEELKREIPEGWKNKKLSDFVDCNKWNRTKESSYDIVNYLDTSSLTKNVIKSHQKLNFGKDKIPSRAQRIVSENDILFSTVRPNLLHYGIIKRPIENLVASTGFAQIRNKTPEVTNDFIYQVLSQDYVTKRLHQIAVGSVSAYPSISHNDIMNLNIAFPLEGNLIKKANVIFQQYNEKIALNLEQNQKLSELRNWLLPMLMNGQITVGEAEKEVESLQMVAEPEAVYETKENAISDLFKTLNFDYEVATIVWLTEQKLGMSYGKKYIHKMFSNIEFLNTLPAVKEITFQENGWGMFSPAIAKTIDNKKFINFENIGYNQSVLKLNYKHLSTVGRWTKKEENLDFVSQVNDMLSVYEDSLIDKNMDRIELLNTVLQCIKMLQSYEFDAIYNKMKNWKMIEDGYETKANKFRPEETKLMIGLVKLLKRNNS